MTPPKCRICGKREHNHRCQGGTAAERIRERLRHKNRELREEIGERLRQAAPYTEAEIARSQARIADVLGIEDESALPLEGGEHIQRGLHGAPPAKPASRRWHTEDGDDGEPRDVVDARRKPARFYAPVGECKYCDRRREAAKRTMRAVRERGEA